MKAMDTLGFFLGLCYAMLAQGCEDTLTPVLVQENGIASFQYKPIATTGTDTYEVLRIDDIVRVRVIYILGTAAAAEVNTGISFTGDEGAGQISFTFTNVQKSDNGIYVLRNSRDQKLQCITLYVSGDFFNVTLSVHKNPVEEKSTVVFNCTAITTTVPSGITIAYLWTFNDKLMTGASEKTYTINNAAESNRGKYTCIALEDILGGQNGTSNEIDLEVVEIPLPEPCCCEKVVCWILVIVAVVLILLIVVIHICLIECEVSELDLSCNLFGIRVLLPGCCICILTVIIHIIVYFVKLDDDECDTVECLVLPLIVKVLAAAGGLVIIAVYVCIRGKKGRPGNEKDDSEGPTCFGGNNSILPICGDLGSTQKDGRQRSTHGVTLATKTTHPPDNSSKTGEAGSFVSGKDVKLDTSRFRPQPPLPGIKSEKTTGNPSPIPESGNKTRLDPIGQETQPRYEDASDSQSGEKKKKKKKKRRSKEGEEGGANVEGISE